MRQAKRTRVLAAVWQSGGRAESRVMNNICERLKDAGVPIAITTVGRPLDLLRIGALSAADVLMVHTPFLYASVLVFVARYVFRKPVVGILWDCYPVTLGGSRYDRSMKRRLLDGIENWILRRCSRIVVPSTDFLQDPRLSGAEVVPLWHPVSIGDAVGESSSADRLNVVFAGQINRTRGLVEAVEALRQATDGRFVLKIASSDPLPDALAHDPRVEHLGFLARAELRKVISAADCGLVCLATQFDGPGFPSKTYDYLEAGIPCLYHGKRLEHYLRVMEASGAGLVLDPTPGHLVDHRKLKSLKKTMSRSAQSFSDEFQLDAMALIDVLKRAAA